MTLDRKTPPPFQQVSNIAFLDAKQSSLDNGIELNYINGGSQEILKIDFIFNAGIWYQQDQLVASATNHLLKEGTKNYSAYEIAEGIDKYGAFLEVECSFDTASVTLYTLNKYLNKVLPLVKEVICFPEFSEKEFNLYKTNTIERFKINQEKGSYVARKEFSSHIFGVNHPYTSNPNEKDYDLLSLEKIKRYYTENYNLNNARILVSGKVENESIDLLNSFFGQSEITTTERPTVIPKSNLTDKRKLFIEKPKALQSAIRIGRQIPNKLHQDYFSLKIFNTILGGYFGSRLMANIREDKGYTYGIGSGLVSLKNGGYFFISTEVGSDVTSNALIEIYKEIDLLCNKEVEKGELELVKNYMLGQLLKGCDGAFNMASLYESVHLYDLNLDYYNRYINAIKNITPKAIQEIGVKYFNVNELKEVVVGKI